MAEKEYIEREAALKRNYFSESKTPDDNYRFNAEIKFCISSLPAADVAPVNHGHWVKEKPDVLIHWHCSVCKNCYYLDEPNANYCPNCGAKIMDGGEEE